MRPALAVIAVVTTLGLTACQPSAPPTDAVAADEAATNAPETTPPTSPAQASDADVAAAATKGPTTRADDIAAAK